MPDNLITDSLLTSMLPDVYVKRISLSNGGTDIVEDNPHIDSLREPKTYKDPKTGKIKRETISVSFDKKGSDSNPTIVDLDLFINEKVVRETVPMWIGNQNFLNYFGVNILQVTDENIIKKIQRKEVKIPDVWKEEGCEVKIISVKEELKKINNLKYFEFRIDSNGNKIYEIPIKTRFALQNTNIKTLVYFVNTYIDLEKMILDMGLDLGPGNLKTMDSKIITESVIKDSSVVSESYVFITRKGEIWCGPYNYGSDGKWRAGEEYNKNSEILELKTVINNKVQDFRQVKEIESLKLNFSFIENNILSRKFLTNNSTDVYRKKSYFTDIFMTRDVEGNCRFCFGIDYLRLIRENTVYGKLYTTDNVSLLKNVRIRSMSIKRIRSSSNPYALKDLDGVAKFTKNEVYENIIVSGEEEYGKFRSYSTEKGSLREVPLLMESMTEEENNGIRHFSGIDKDMSKVTFGLYQYGIDLDIEDNTYNYILNKLDKLLSAYSFLLDYLNDGSVSQNYNINDHRFTELFIEKMKNIYGDNNPLSPWILPVVIYLDCLSTFDQTIDYAKYTKILSSFIHPVTGNLDGVNVLLRLLETIIEKLKEVTRTSCVYEKPTVDSNNRKTFNYSSVLKRGGSNFRKSLRISMYFKDLFDSDYPKDYGYDFLGIDTLFREKNNDGLKSVSVTDYAKRTELETLKYFKSMNENIDIKSDSKVYTQNDSLESNRYMYLTPSNIRSGVGNNLQLLNGFGTFNYEDLNSMGSTVSRFNSMKKSPSPSIKAVSPLINTGGMVRNVGTVAKPSQTNSSVGNILIKTTVTDLKTELKNIQNSLSENIKSTSSDLIISAANVFKGSSNFVTTDYVVKQKSKNDVSVSNKIINSSPKDFLTDIVNKEIVSQKDLITKRYTSPVSLSQFDITVNKGIKPVSLPYNKSIPSTTVSGKATESLATFVPKLPGVPSSFTPPELPKGFVLKNPPPDSRGTTTPLLSVSKNISSAATSIVPPVVSPMTEASRIPSDVFSSGGKTITRSPVQDLPNQIKSLVVDSSSPGKVVKSWKSEEVDPRQESDKEATFSFNYEAIRKIEVLIGYEYDVEGYNIIKKPIWTKLTPELFSKASEKNLLCRLVEYEDNTFNLKLPEKFKMPTYNEYFILCPEGEIVSLVPSVTKSSSISMINISTNLSSDSFKNRSTGYEYEVTVTGLPPDDLLNTSQESSEEIKKDFIVFDGSIANYVSVKELPYDVTAATIEDVKVSDLVNQLTNISKETSVASVLGAKQTTVSTVPTKTVSFGTTSTNTLLNTAISVITDTTKVVTSGVSSVSDLATLVTQQSNTNSTTTNTPTGIVPTTTVDFGTSKSGLLGTTTRTTVGTLGTRFKLF